MNGAGLEFQSFFREFLVNDIEAAFSLLLHCAPYLFTTTNSPIPTFKKKLMCS